MSAGPDAGGPRHPLAGAGPAEARVITILDPDGYVLVDGLLLRAAADDAPPPYPGATVRVHLDHAADTLTARRPPGASGSR